MEKQILPCCSNCAWPCGGGVKCRCELERDVCETFKPLDQEQTQQEHTLSHGLAK